MIGDPTTRRDRPEPELNGAIPDDIRSSLQSTKKSAASLPRQREAECGSDIKEALAHSIGPAGDAIGDAMMATGPCRPFAQFDGSGSCPVVPAPLSDVKATSESTLEPPGCADCGATQTLLS